MIWVSMIATFLIAFISVDMYYFISGTRKTFSAEMVIWTQEYPILPFIIGLVIGILAGHFWPVTGHLK